MGGIPEATSRASLLEVIGALRQRAKAFFWMFSSGFKSCEVAVCQARHPYSKTGLTRPKYSLISFLLESLAIPLISLKAPKHLLAL